MTPLFISKKQLLDQLKIRDQQLLNFKAENETLKFHLKNISEIKKYEGNYITADLFVKQALIKTGITQEKDNPLALIMMFLFAKKSITEPQLYFLVEDLKTEISLELSLKEVEALYNEFIS